MQRAPDVSAATEPRSTRCPRARQALRQTRGRQRVLRRANTLSASLLVLATAPQVSRRRHMQDVLKSAHHSEAAGSAVGTGLEFGLPLCLAE